MPPWCGKHRCRSGHNVLFSALPSVYLISAWLTSLKICVNQTIETKIGHEACLAKMPVLGPGIKKVFIGNWISVDGVSRPEILPIRGVNKAGSSLDTG